MTEYHNDLDPHFQDRVHQSFEQWRSSVKDRIKPEEEEHVQGIRDAVVVKDKEKIQGHLETTRSGSSWINEELMKHPEISAIMRELAILGF